MFWTSDVACCQSDYRDTDGRICVLIGSMLYKYRPIMTYCSHAPKWFELNIRNVIKLDCDRKLFHSNRFIFNISKPANIIFYSWKRKIHFSTVQVKSALGLVSTIKTSSTKNSPVFPKPVLTGPPTTFVVGLLRPAVLNGYWKNIMGTRLNYFSTSTFL